MKKLITFLLLLFFLGGLGAERPFLNSAEGRPKKIVYKKIYRKKVPKKYRRVKIKKPKRYFKKKKTAKKVRHKVPKRAAKPAKSRFLTQRYVLEEGFDEVEADRLKDSLATLGVKDVTADVDNNTLTVQFDTRKLSALHIIQKLKSLGYTVKRIQ
jgi:copper chaperone CopZ